MNRAKQNELKSTLRVAVCLLAIRYIPEPFTMSRDVTKICFSINSALHHFSPSVSIRCLNKTTNRTDIDLHSMFIFPSLFLRREEMLASWIWFHRIQFKPKDATSVQQILLNIYLKIHSAGLWLKWNLLVWCRIPFGCLVYVFSQRCLMLIPLIVFIYYLAHCIWQPWLVKRFPFNLAQKCCLFNMIPCRVRPPCFFWKCNQKYKFSNTVNILFMFRVLFSLFSNNNRMKLLNSDSIHPFHSRLNFRFNFFFLQFN